MQEQISILLTRRVLASQLETMRKHLSMLSSMVQGTLKSEASLVAQLQMEGYLSSVSSHAHQPSLASVTKLKGLLKEDGSED